MKYLILLLTLVVQAHAYEAPQCRSELLRVKVAGDAIGGVTAQSVLNVLRNVAPQLQDLLQREYPIEDIPFPAKKEDCDRLGINCSENFCLDKNVPESQKAELCFALMCSLIEGPKNTGKCGDSSMVYGSTIGFPTPVVIENIAWDIKSINATGREARMCFRLNQLELSLSTKFSFDVSQTRLTDNSVTVSNIRGVLDSPKDICVTATIDIASRNPVSNVRIATENNQPFISENMIRQAARSVEVSGLTGYSPRELRAVIPELLPVLVYPMRETLEASVAEALGKVLEEQVAEHLGKVQNSNDPLLISSEAFMSELSFTPARLWESIAYHECRQLVLSGKQIPANHACIGLDVTFSNLFNTPEGPNRKITTSSDARFFLEGWTLSYDMSYPQSWPNVVSETFRKRLVALKEIILKGELLSDLNAEEIQKVQRERQSMIRGTIDPFLAQIAKKRNDDSILRNVEVHGDLSSGVSRGIGLALPGICSATTPSPHASANIPNCPIQAYIDVKEFNRVLSLLWETGRICDGGKGPYVQNAIAPMSNGCQLPTDAVSCVLNNAPQLKQEAGGRFSTAIKLKNCRKNILPFGIFGAHGGGDFNISFSFRPKPCFNGDFCIDQPRVTWSLAPGSATGLLQDPFIRSQVTQAFDKGISAAMSKTLRIPFGSATSGFLSHVPLKFEGRTKVGTGYFGVCLKEDR